jgi:stress response protein YsnF
VLEEMLVVERRLVLKEEIRITKRRIDETEQARVVVREEHVDIENLGASEPMA